MCVYVCCIKQIMFIDANAQNRHRLKELAFIRINEYAPLCHIAVGDGAETAQGDAYLHPNGVFR